MPFTALLHTLDHSPRPQDKVRALSLYFQSAPHADAAWALHLATGKRLPRTITPIQIKEWAAHAANIPAWLADESFTTVGDAAEAAALLIPEPATPSPENPIAALSLKEIIEDHLLSLSRLDPTSLQQKIIHIWSQSTVPQRTLYNRLLLGATGIKLPGSLVLKALADAFEISHAQIATRLTVDWRPTADAFARLITKDHAQIKALGDTGHPYPFQSAIPHSLSSALSFSASLFTRSPEPPPKTPNPPLPQRAEWLYDGIRVQLIKRHGRWLLWSHTTTHHAHQPVTATFPEFAITALALPDGTVLDAIITPWANGRPSNVASLLARMDSGPQEPSLWNTPADRDSTIDTMLIVFDLLEHQGQDIRRLPLSQRLALLTPLLTPLTREHPIRLADAWPSESWEACDHARRQARSLSYRGIILKPLDAPYSDPPSPWLALKSDPLTIDCVLTAAQPAPLGRRGNQYTLSVWNADQLVSVAKADSGLPDNDLKHIDQFIRANTTAKHGPVRSVTPHLVLQVAFDAALPAPRHKSGLILQNPILRHLKPNTPPAKAATLQALKLLATL